MVEVSGAVVATEAAKEAAAKEVAAKVTVSSSRTVGVAVTKAKARAETGAPGIVQTLQSPSVTAIIDMGRKLGTVSSP